MLGGGGGIFATESMGKCEGRTQESRKETVKMKKEKLKKIFFSFLGAYHT